MNKILIIRSYDPFHVYLCRFIPIRHFNIFYYSIYFMSDLYNHNESESQWKLYIYHWWIVAWCSLFYFFTLYSIWFTFKTWFAGWLCVRWLIVITIRSLKTKLILETVLAVTLQFIELKLERNLYSCLLEQQSLDQHPYWVHYESVGYAIIWSTVISEPHHVLCKQKHFQKRGFDYISLPVVLWKCQQGRFSSKIFISQNKLLGTPVYSEHYHFGYFFILNIK